METPDRSQPEPAGPTGGDEIGDESALAFYDGFATDYHLLWGDWWEAALRHGRIVARLLGDRGLAPPASVLDCSCGIGTQALSLAHLGYAVTGTDLSPKAVERARREADLHGVDVTLAVADMRSIDTVVRRTFDAVISCDNSLPHLLTDKDLTQALASIRRCLEPGGLFLASLRDYDQLAEERPAGTVPYLVDSEDERRIIGQAWEWEPDGESLGINLFILHDQGDQWTCSMRTTRYRALRRPVLTAALEAAGFAAVTWLAPGTTGFYQPIVAATAS